MAISNRTVKREMNSRVRELGKMREIIVIVDPSSGLIGFRPKGLRRTEWLPSDFCWSMAVKARVAEERRARRKK